MLRSRIVESKSLGLFSVFSFVLSVEAEENSREVRRL